MHTLACVVMKGLNAYISLCVVMKGLNAYISLRGDEGGKCIH